MKKIGLLLALVLTVSTLAGCDKKEHELSNMTSSNSENSTSQNKEDLVVNNQPNLIKDKEEGAEDVETNKADDTEVTSPDNTNLKEGRIYYYEGFEAKNYYIKAQLPENNKDKLNLIIESLKKLPDNDFLESVEYQEFTPLPGNVFVKSADFTSDTVKIDFNSNFTETLGTSGETSVIESLVKTIEYNFSINKVIITFNGENYSSGHIAMEDGEWFEANNNESIELKNIK